MDIAYVDTPLGMLELQASTKGLQSATFCKKLYPATLHIPKPLRKPALQLEEYFTNKRNKFSLKLDLQGTEFQLRVWDLLYTIPYGKTVSYHDMAKRLGNPKVIRAAANANGKNPISIIIPCHRVIGSDGSLKGYAGGLHRKKWLLNHECDAKQGLLF